MVGAGTYTVLVVDSGGGNVVHIDREKIIGRDQGKPVVREREPWLNSSLSSHSLKPSGVHWWVICSCLADKSEWSWQYRCRCCTG